MIVTLQALLGFGDRLLTDQEYKNYFISHAPKFQQYYPLYIEQLNELSNHCTDTADLTKIFDNVHKPIIYDNGHTLRTGNEIISEIKAMKGIDGVHIMALGWEYLIPKMI